MKCLFKYKWVKLRRDLLPRGKGIMGYWGKLASRVAFRKGNAFYCGHINEVEVGEWVGGMMGLKSILGVSNKQKALDILDKLSELGYIEYELDGDTKRLRYKILDYVFECSGAECENDNVYATNAFGFICVPRNITERLIEKGYVFEESDAWLDLWIHTIFNDKKNFLTFFSPGVTFDDFFSFLSLEALSKRWGWEKTKTWRFFQKNKEVYKLIRLPGTYGCLIYNKLYPANKEIKIPDSEKIEAILKKTKEIFNEYGIDCRHSNLAVLIHEYSELLIEKYFQKENSVALFDYIIRAYISPCWSFCNFFYDCKDILVFTKIELRKNKIRGPCELLGFSRKGEFMLRSKGASAKSNEKKSLLKKLEMERCRVVMYALRKYRRYHYELNLLKETLYKEYGLPKEVSFDKLICWEPAMESLQAQIVSIRNIHVFLETLRDAADCLVRFSKKGNEIYYIMKESYFNEKGKTMEQIAEDLSISKTSCYRFKNMGFKLLCKYLWDVPIEVNRENNTIMSFYDLYMEVCYGK